MKPLPVTVDELFQAGGVSPSGPVAWGTPIPDRCPGVYVITVEGECDPATLLGREAARWLTGQSVVYIGRTSVSLAGRLNQFYKHQYGARSPHRGGQAVLLLKERYALLVRWACCEDYAGAEHTMIEEFRSRTGQMPFANRVRSARVALVNEIK